MPLAYTNIKINNGIKYIYAMDYGTTFFTVFQ